MTMRKFTTAVLMIALMVMAVMKVRAPRKFFFFFCYLIFFQNFYSLFREMGTLSEEATLPFLCHLDTS